MGAQAKVLLSSVALSLALATTAITPARAAGLNLETATIADLNAAFASGTLTSEQVVDAYLKRIAAFDKQGPNINAVLTLNPRAVAEARALIRDQLQRVMHAGTTTVVLASAAPGADIICHELCHELGIDSTLCLPMPSDDYAREVFGARDDWRSRYLALSAPPRSVLQLSDQPRLPHWLDGSGLDPWERGNRWVLEMARTSGATKVTLLALWDRKPAGGGPGGTAHMVQLARNAGDVDVVVIEAEQLLA